MMMLLNTIISLMFGCGSPSSTMGANIDYDKLCRSPHDKTLKWFHDTDEIAGFDSIPSVETFSYTKLHYTVVMKMADLDSLLKAQASCNRPDSSMVSFYLHAYNSIHSVCDSGRISKSDSVVIEKVIVHLGYGQSICLLRNDEKKCRSYKISTLPHSLSMCGGASPTYKSLWDFNPNRFEKRRGKNKKQSDATERLYEDIATSFDEWVGGGGYYEPEDPSEIYIERSFMDEILND